MSQYDAFGNVGGSGGSWSGPFGYAGAFGYQEDGDSGLKLLGHRYYDSSTGRFLTRDPIKDGRNWYSYCDNKPVSSVDPNGLYILPVLGIIEAIEENITQVGFDSADDAASVVLFLILDQSLASGDEYGGWVYLKDGQYYVTEPRTDGYNSTVHPGLPKPEGAVATYHTHPFKNGETSETTGKVLWGNSLISQPDIEFNEINGTIPYIIDEDGKIWKWDYETVKQLPVIRR